MKVLINSTVLSNFAAVGRLTLLYKLYGTVYIAEAVYEEAQDGLEEGYTFLAGLDEYIFPSGALLRQPHRRHQPGGL